ncbi:hypothetical protein BGZ94_005985 [Podila epigama]|nr:hypothetical protein BGZ94_005985 [Podila epigama]
MTRVAYRNADLYLQKVSGQSPGPANGTTKSRSTLTGPRPPTFKTSGRKIFQDSITSPTNLSSTQLENAVNNLNMSSVPNTPVQPRAASPVLESMGETPAETEVMESMGSDGHEPVMPLQQPCLAHSHHYGTYHGQVHGPNHGQGHAYGYSTIGYGTMPAQHSHVPYYDPSQQQYQQQQYHPTHMSQEQYLQLQQQQLQQQQEYLRQQHAAHAAAHGYIPSPPSSTPVSAHMAQPAPEATSNVTTTTPQPKTIAPRIVPIVPIPKYTIVNPPKTEIETLNDEQDDDWAPEPPPRDPPKAADKPSSRPPSRPHTPITPLQSESFSAIATIQPKQFEPGEHPQASNSSHSSPSSTRPPSLTSSSLQSQPQDEPVRVPLPPPREFRRKSETPVLPTTVVNRPRSNYFIPGVSPSTTTTSINTSSTTSTISVGSSMAKPSSLSKTNGAPTPGTVRDNSAKFNALATTTTTTGSGGAPKTFTPKTTKNSTFTSASDATATATSNPWTTRKAVDHLRKNSLSKGSGPTMLSNFVPKSKRLSETPATPTSSSSPTTVTTSTVAITQKELPPIRSSSKSPAPTPVSPSGAVNGRNAQDDVLQAPEYGVDYDSKCVLTDEHKEDATLPDPPASAFSDSARALTPVSKENTNEIAKHTETIKDAPLSSKGPTTSPSPSPPPPSVSTAGVGASVPPSRANNKSGTTGSSAGI